MSFRVCAWRTVFVVCVAFGAGSAAHADYREQLSGRTLDIMVGFSNSGGGAQFWSLFSTHMRRQLPDTIIRAEFKDGALAVDGIEELYETKAGALAIGLIRPPELVFVQIDNPEEFTGDFRDAHWLLSVENLSYIMAARSGLTSDPAELRNLDDVLILPVSDPLSTATRVSVLLSAVTSIPTRIVVGFDRSARTKALLAGDADLLTVAIEPELVPVITSGDIVPLYKIVGEDFSTLDASTPDLTAFLRADAPASVVAFIRSARGMGRAFFAPPNTDPADVAAFRELLEAIVADPEFIQDAQLKGIPIAAKSGDILAQQISDLVPADDAERALILNAHACGLAMSLDPAYTCAF